MNVIFQKCTLLKWLFLPVIILMRLIVVEVEEFVLCIPCPDVFRFFEPRPEFNKSPTMIDYKVRMNR